MPSRALNLLLLLAMAAPLAAQTDTVPPPDQPARPKIVANGRISGTVLCGDTRKPARGAVLMVSAIPKANADGTSTYSEGSRETMTRVGLDGTYTAEHLAPGEYGIAAILPGYLTAFDDLVANQMEDSSPAAQRALYKKLGTIVIRGAEAETFNITLERGAAVSGRILYSDGSPAAQVTIDLENVATKPVPGARPQDNLNVGRVMRSMFTQQSNSTDDQGRFRLSGLQPGKYRVAAVQSFGAGAAGGDGMGMMFGAMIDPAALRFYSGDTIHQKSARTYELRAGDEITGIDITIPEHAFHRVAGRLIGAAGRTPTSSTVTLTDTADETLVYSATVGESGYRNPASGADAGFAFPAVPSGTYTLAVKGAQYLPPFEYKPLPDGNSPVPPPPTAFAPASISVLVKEADIPDLTITLTEIPPDTKPAAAAPSPPQ